MQTYLVQFKIKYIYIYIYIERERERERESTIFETSKMIMKQILLRLLYEIPGQ
jgi:hypothetical protein